MLFFINIINVIYPTGIIAMIGLIISPFGFPKSTILSICFLKSKPNFI